MSKGLGNPLIMAAMSTPGGQKAMGDATKGITYALLFVGAGAGLWYGYGAYRKYLVSQFMKEHGHESDVQTAFIFYKSMKSMPEQSFAFGLIQFDMPDGTNEPLLYIASKRVQSFEAVQEAYKKVFDRDLLIDISSELDSDEYLSFLDNLVATDKYVEQKETTYEALTPLKVGDTVIAMNPKGTRKYEAVYENGNYTFGAVDELVKLDEEIGEIRLVLINDDKTRITYLIGDWCSFDKCAYNYLVDHREVKMKTYR